MVDAEVDLDTQAAEEVQVPMDVANGRFQEGHEGESTSLALLRSISCTLPKRPWRRPSETCRSRTVSDISGGARELCYRPGLTSRLAVVGHGFEGLLERCEDFDGLLLALFLGGERGFEVISIEVVEILIGLKTPR